MDELIEHLLNEKRKGKGFGEIRKLLEADNIEEEKIKQIIRSIDNRILLDEAVKNQNQKAKEMIIMGVFVMLVGLVITITTYMGLINMGKSYFLAYGPIIGGLGILLTGAAKYRKR